MLPCPKVSPTPSGVAGWSPSHPASALKGLHLFEALDSTIPVEFPEDEDEGESEDEDSKDVKPSTELLNVLTLQ